LREFIQLVACVYNDNIETDYIEPPSIVTTVEKNYIRLLKNESVEYVMKLVKTDNFDNKRLIETIATSEISLPQNISN
jgi:hypothetical protein